MQKGICQLSLIPMRAEAASRSEMVSQLLLGETYDVLDQTEDWVKIRTHADHYEAWISKNQYQKWDGLEAGIQIAQAFPFMLATHKEHRTSIFVLPGSFLHHYSDWQKQFQINREVYEIEGMENQSDKISLKEMLHCASLFLNSPYLWGGKTFLGIDCSGFVQVLFRMAGIQLPRDAYQQAEWGERVEFLDAAEAGDLAFFDNAEGKITHVGLIVAPGEIIHASGKVRRDVLDSYGIYNEQMGKHTHQLRSIRRIL